MILYAEIQWKDYIIIKVCYFTGWNPRKRSFDIEDCLPDNQLSEVTK